MDDSAVMPGSIVHTTEGFFGFVERVITDPGGIDLEALEISRNAGKDRYRLPASLVRRVDTEEGMATVQLAATPADLERYRLPEGAAPARSEHVAQPREHDTLPGGGLVERLHAGLESLTSTVREALEGPEPADERAPGGGDQGIIRVPVAEEHLVARTERVPIGHLRVHKSVESAQETISVNVAHEEPEIDYISVDEYDPKAPYQAGETYIPIMGEQIVVEKRQVITGYMRVRKRLVSEERQITETVQRERVTVEQEPREEP